MSFNIPPVAQPYTANYGMPMPQPLAPAPMQPNVINTPYANIVPYSFPQDPAVAKDNGPKPYQTLMEFSYAPVISNNPNQPSQVALTYRFPPFVPMPPKGSILQAVWLNENGVLYPGITAMPASVPNNGSAPSGFNMTA